MSRHSFRASFICSALLLALGATSALAEDLEPETPQQGLRVTYLVFSGRPNPSVTLTDPALVRAIEERLRGALAAGPRAAASAAQPILGYNGIMIERLGAADTGSWFVLRRDVLRVEGATEKSGAPATSAPPSAVSKTVSELETFLLSMGRDQGALDEAMLSVVQLSN